MAALTVKAHGSVRTHGVLGLIAVVERMLRAEDLFHRKVQPADARQGVLHLPALGPQLFGVAHVAVDAAAAPAKDRAVWLPPLRGRLRDLHDLSGVAGLHDLRDAQLHRLAADGAGYKDHRAADANDPKALAGVALYCAGSKLPD